jgi:catechol 2,3-dioxygenase-like lactoylglutathione lyase family enzyme
MSVNRFNHIDLRVPRLEEALPFYAALLPALGFTRTRHDAQWKVFGFEGAPLLCYFGLTEEKGHRPNSNRVAFWVDSRAEVDRIGDLVRRAGALNMDGPKACPHYSSSYYAVFFEDPSGNRLEVCHRTD